VGGTVAAGGGKEKGREASRGNEDVCDVLAIISCNIFRHNAPRYGGQATGLNFGFFGKRMPFFERN